MLSNNDHEHKATAVIAIMRNISNNKSKNSSISSKSSNIHPLCCRSDPLSSAARLLIRNSIP